MRFASLIAACALIVAGINQSTEAVNPSIQSPKKIAWNLPQVVQNTTRAIECANGQCTMRPLKVSDLSVQVCPDGKCPLVDGRIDPVTNLPASISQPTVAAAPVVSQSPVVSHSPRYVTQNRQPVRRVVTFVRTKQPVRTVARRVVRGVGRVVTAPIRWIRSR